MNALKNMEVVFLASLALAGFMSYATADVAPAAPAAVSATSDIATVVVTAKRLTVAEKANLGS